MIDIPVALGTFKTMWEIVGSMKGLHDAAALNSAVIELQNQMLAAQAEQFELIEQVRHLEQQLQKLNHWREESNRYQLLDFGSETFAYVLKPEASNGEPPHKLCINCYESSRKSILLRVGGSMNGQQTYRCSHCSSEFMLGDFHRPDRNTPKKGSWMV